MEIIRACDFRNDQNGSRVIGMAQGPPKFQSRPKVAHGWKLTILEGDLVQERWNGSLFKEEFIILNIDNFGINL